MEHEGELKRREQASNPEYEEVYYFTITEEWAKTRIENSTVLDEIAKGDFLVLMDIRQDTFLTKVDTTLKVYPSYNKLMILNLENDFSFSYKRFGSAMVNAKIKSSAQESIIENTLWREFMSARLGLLLTEVTFPIGQLDKIEAFHLFEKAFKAYQSTKQ